VTIDAVRAFLLSDADRCDGVVVLGVEEVAIQGEQDVAVFVVGVKLDL
jgi:hypothetical protein